MEHLTFKSFFVYDGIPSFRDSDLATMYRRSAYEKTMAALNFEGDLTDENAFVRVAKSAAFFAEFSYQNVSCGFTWLNRFEHRRAHAHFCFWRPSPGPSPLVLGPLVMEKLLHFQNGKGEFVFDCIWGIAPAANVPAVMALKACGVTVSATVKNYIWDASAQKSVDGVHFHVTRSSFPPREERT